MTRSSTRALEPWSFGIYAGGQSILVGTPSGVTLAPEGGAHQSIITPSIGLEQPRCVAWEPAFVQDLEWIAAARARRARPAGWRVGVPPAEHAPGRPGAGGAARRRPAERERGAEQVLAGGYRAPRGCEARRAVVAGRGRASSCRGDRRRRRARSRRHRRRRRLPDLGRPGVTARCRPGSGLAEARDDDPRSALPRSAAAPIVSVLDGHPHTLSFLAAVTGTPIASPRRPGLRPVRRRRGPLRATSGSTPRRSSAPHST